MLVELLQNVAVLIALVVGLQMLARQLAHRPLAYGVAAGLLFGAAGIIGMTAPLRFAPGVIYDGRSIVLAIAGLFGGPVAAAIAAVACGAYRALLGGPGALPGVLVVIEAAALGVALHYLRRRDERWLGLARLWAFGILVHVLMLALQLLLPDGRGWEVARRIGPAVLLVYPLGFVLTARLFLQAERSVQAEQALRENEERFRALVEGAPDAIFVQVDHRFAYVNEAAVLLYGAGTAGNLLGTPVMDRFDPAQRGEIARRIEGLNLRRERAPALEEIHRRLDGSEVQVEVSAVPVEYGGRNGAIVFVRDITARKEMEQRLVQSQKMEAVGRLAGGVAHDFNNMLQTILGYTELLIEKTPPGSANHDELAQIRKAALRSADLTRQLLGFARRQVIEPQALDLSTVVSDLLRMLRRLVGENVGITWRPAPDPCPVRMDPSQVGQVLTNLVVNARDAIPGTGLVTIETSHAEMDEDYCLAHPGAAPGRYEVLVVSDDGVGMDRETRERAFEPFYTTKERGKGTGLGLATVFGIVKQNDGFINLYSEPGRGTTVRIYLRRDEAPGTDVADTSAANGTVGAPGGTECVLLVEDETSLLQLGSQILGRLGYRVLAVADPHAALALVRERGERPDILLTDVIMPGLNGRDLFTELGRELPGLRCLYMSGYTDNVIAHLGVLEDGVNFLQKPFSGRELAKRLRQALDEPR